MRRLPLVLVLFILTFVTARVSAQQSEQPPANPPPQSPDQSNPFAMWDVQKMIDRATSQVVKRYALTPEQETFTRNLMATRVNGFLDKHESEIRDIFAQAIKYQISGEPPPAEKVKEWTALITPMFDEAKVSIIEGNRDFREILTDDQKKIHDIDLKVMERNFKDAEQRLSRWGEGGFDPAKDLGPPKPGARPATRSASTTRGAPATPTPQAAQDTAVPPAPPPNVPSRIVPPGTGSTDRSADFWEMYVRRFIANYALDQTQANLAMQILEETKKRAREYLASRKDEYQNLQTRLSNAGGDQAVAAEIQKQIAELNKPIQGDLFNEMKQRLEQIPTEAQRKAYDEAHPNRATASGPASRPVASRPTGTRPTASRPALRRMAPTTRPAIGPTGVRTPTNQPTAPK